MGGYIGSRAVNLSTTAADVSGNATIGGNLTVSGTTVTIDSANAQTVDLGDNDKIRLGDGDDLQIYHDGSNSHISNATGNLTFDVAGNIILDADSAEIIFKDGGTSFGRVFNSSGNFYINAPTADTDIIIQGNDGGSDVNALSFDMSNAGFASFNNGITLKNELYLNNADASATVGYLYNDSNNFVIRNYTQDVDILFKGNDGGSVITALTLDMSDAGTATFNHDINAGGNLVAKGYLASEATNSTNKWLAYTYTDNTFRINYNGAGADEVTITSSGDVLVGKTTTAIGTAGSRFISNGQIQATADGNEPFFANRLSSDGVLFDFRHDGTTVGSIKSRSSGGNLQINTVQSGIDFGGDGYLPMRNGSITDNSLDMGSSSFRYKNLYLSGGVVFDAVAGDATSNTLDDYEEGSWLIRIRDGSGNIIGDSNNVGRYVKVGDLVHASFSVQRSDSGSHTGNLMISGWPFSVNTASNLVLVGSGGIWVDNGTGSDYVSSTVYHNGTYLFGVMDHRIDSGNRYIKATQVNNGRPVYGSYVYRST